MECIAEIFQTVIDALHRAWIAWCDPRFNSWRVGFICWQLGATAGYLLRRFEDRFYDDEDEESVVR